MLKETVLYYFSPSGGTRKVAEIFCNTVSEHVHAVNLAAKGDVKEYPQCELAVFAVPVFGGRIPSAAAEKLRKLNGAGQKTVTFAVYGVRAYDDALLEVNDIAQECGFQVIASGAVNAQHSMVPEIGAGRPDEQDAESIGRFAQQVLDKLERGAEVLETVPGNRPYKAEMNLTDTPVSLDGCNLCGVCAKICPVDAIRIENNQVTADGKTCILCMACVYACPQKVRVLPDAVLERTGKLLEPCRNVYRENEFFI